MLKCDPAYRAAFIQNFLHIRLSATVNLPNTYKYYKGEGIGKIDWSKPHNLLKVDTKLLKLFPNSRGMQIHHSKAAAATSWLCFHSRLEMNPSEYMNHVISKSSDVKESSKKYICIYINQPKKWFSNKTKWLELIILDLQEISVGLF